MCIRDRRERLGQTIVLVTHDESLALRADRRIVMSDGLIPVSYTHLVGVPPGNEIALLRFSVSTVKSDGFQRFFVYSFCVSRNFFYFGAFIGISEILIRVTEKKQTNYNKLIYTQCKVKVTRSTEVLVNLSANKLSPRKSIGENCLSCG